jgi:ABC-type uncharacterized transport system ATPase subunit
MMLLFKKPKDFIKKPKDMVKSLHEKYPLAVNHLKNSIFLTRKQKIEILNLLLNNIYLAA